MQRRQTQAFLKAQGELVAVVRPIFEETATGGKKEIDKTTLLKQRIALVRGTPGGPEYGGESARTDLGDTTKSRDRIMARHDVDLQKKDRLELQGRVYEVQEVDRNSFRTAGKITTWEADA